MIELHQVMVMEHPASSRIKGTAMNANTVIDQVFDVLDGTLDLDSATRPDFSIPDLRCDGGGPGGKAYC